MKSTIASSARTRRSASAQPSISAVPTTRVTRQSSRADSVRDVAADPTLPKPTTKPQPKKPKGPTSRAGPQPGEQALNSKAVPAKPRQDKLNDATAAPAFEGNAKFQRTGYGDARAAREDQMGVAMSETAKAKGLIDDETAQNWSTSWRTKGHIVLNWTQQTIDKYNAENGIVPEEVMSLEEAEAIKKKKDKDLEEWCIAYYEGIIDENGNPTAPGDERPVVKPKSKSRERDARREAARKKDPLREVQSGKVVKKGMSKKTPNLPTILEVPSPAPAPTLAPTLAPNLARARPRPLAPAPASGPAAPLASGPSAPVSKPAIKKATTKPATAAPTKAAKSKKKPDEAPIAPLPGRPTYGQYHYYQLVALCGERNIKSGNGTQAVRNRLIQDDINIIQNLPRDAKNYAKDAREKKHVAPVVANAPIAPPAILRRSAAPQKSSTKRSRDDDEDDDDDDDDQPEPKGKKAKMA